MDKIEMGKEYRARDGRDARVLCVDLDGHSPVVAFVGNVIWRYTAKGFFHEDGRHSSIDLVEVKPRIKKTVWLNIYEDGCDCYESKQQAYKQRTDYCIACFELNLDIERGHGLESRE